jgi:type II secretion system protein C
MQRAMPALVALLIGAGAFVAAFGVNTVIGSLVAPDETVAGAAGDLEGLGGSAPQAQMSSNRSGPRAKSEQVYLDGILCRNVFDPESISDCQDRVKSNRGGGSGAMSDLPVTLVGTMVADPAEYSVAFIREDGKETGSFGISDSLLDAVIIGIEQDRVKVRRSNRSEEFITMDEERREKKPERRASSNADDDEEGIEKVGENKFVVSRDLLDKYINDIESISRMGRALLHRGPDGEFDGYRLSAIRRNTLADKLGIRNGDVVHSVNGQSLNSVQSAMEAYQTMTSENAFSFEVTRRGQKVDLDYSVE